VSSWGLMGWSGQASPSPSAGETLTHFNRAAGVTAASPPKKVHKKRSLLLLLLLLHVPIWSERKNAGLDFSTALTGLWALTQCEKMKSELWHICTYCIVLLCAAHRKRYVQSTVTCFVCCRSKSEMGVLEHTDFFKAGIS